MERRWREGEEVEREGGGKNSVTDRFDCSLKAGMIVESSGAQRTLACRVNFLKRLSEERHRSLHCTHVTGDTVTMR